MTYRNFRIAFWTDPKVRRLKPQMKLLFSYLITNPHSHYCGLYYISPLIIMEETGLSIKTVKYGIDILSKAYLIQYDHNMQIVWVVTMLKDCPLNEKMKIGIPNHLKTLHNCNLINSFLNYYKDLGISYQYPTDTPPIGNPPVLVLEPVLEEETETTTAESDKSPSAAATPKISFSYEKRCFDNIKQSYLDQWKKAYPAVSVYPEIRKMEAWASANPKNRKSNWQRFIVNWLTKAQDRAGTDKAQPQGSSQRHGGRSPNDYAGATPKGVQSPQEQKDD